MSNLLVQRYSIPHKGWNTITPIREMGHEYAPVLENHWFDQAGGMNRRPGQIPATTTPLGGAIEFLFEYRDLAGASVVIAWANNGLLYAQSGAIFTQIGAPNGSAFVNRPRAVQMGGALLIADGIAARTYTTIGGWQPAPAGSAPMNMFTVYKGRCYGAGNPAQKMTVYYSDVVGVGSAGLTDWTATGPGGLIDLTGSIGTGDEITGLTTFQGMLVVFLKNAIVFYSGANPVTASVQKVIRGIGCVSHDTIAGIGNDTIFLSQYGFKKLTEIAVQGDAAAGDASSAINNYVVDQLLNNNVAPTTLRSTFAEKLGVYLCTFGTLTLAYHVFFDAWVPWYGLSPTLYTKEDGTVLCADTYMQEVSTTANSDKKGVAAESSILTRWDSAPFKASNSESKARWRMVEIIYESRKNEQISVSTWRNFDISTMRTDFITLNPGIIVPTPNSMIWTTGIGSTNLRMYWGGGGNINRWPGTNDLGTAMFAGDARIPVTGRSEILSMRVANSNISKFKITANEVYKVEGGLRK